MDFLDAFLVVSGFGLIWLVINMIVADLKRRGRIKAYLPIEYYKSDKGWWKNW